MTIAVKVENLGKCFLLGESFEHTLSSRVGDLLRGRLRRASGREEYWALKDVNFEVAEGEAIGIIGNNGAGKSTLLKVLSRITPPTTGRASVRGRLSSLLEVGTGFHPELTGRENVFLNGAILGMRKHEVQRKFDEIVAFSGVEKFIDTPVKRYSSGMYVRLAFAVAAHLEPDVLIIDEVLAVGDADFQKRCLGKMNDVARQGRTVLFVSHNMAAVQKLCTRAIWMRDGSVAMAGATESVITEYLDSGSRRLADGASLAPGVLYAHDPDGSPEDTACVTSLEMLAADGRPLDEAATCNPVRFRIGFSTARPYRSFSVVLQVSTADGVPLILTSTTPDHQQAFGVEPGCHFVDCDFESFPLAAGEYVLGLGLAIPGVEYVWRDEALCRLHVAPRDIYGSGLPPASNRYLVASSHHWSMPRKCDVQEGEASHG
ncbi:MAG: ABC transporter ATP-binding protein [Proteobacteria bacterium]|nr:ABC transporter ATP-binding protein [Pseudomonadota bacterium]